MANKIPLKIRDDNFPGELQSGDTIAGSWIDAASTTVVGVNSNATSAEITAGTATKAITPAQLKGSAIFGTKTIGMYVIEGTVSITTGDGKAYFPPLPPAYNGMNLISARASVITAGTTNATTIQIHNETDNTDMLSSNISIASGAKSGTGTVNTSYDDVATNDVLRVDVDAVSTTAPKGLLVTLEFQLP